MQEPLAAVAVLALIVGGGAAIVAALLGRRRLALRLVLGGVTGFAVAFVGVVFVRVLADERVMFLGAVAACVGLPTMSVPFFFAMLRGSQSIPAWTDAVMHAGAGLLAAGMVLILVGAVLAGRL